MCEDPIAGTWRSQKYRRREWSRFDLRIERDGAVLRGTIRSHIWTGSPGDPRPSCGTFGIDNTWVMEASGRIDGEGITFGANGRARMIDQNCPSLGDGYAPDHFEGRVDPMRDTLQVRNNDGAYDIEEPYTTPDDKPFSWQGRMRVVGGRTNVWGRQSYRLSEQDLKGKSFDGYGEDWPLSYADLVTYYEIIEDYVGISGQAEGVPELPDSKFHPAMPMSCAETQLRTRVKSKLGWTVTIGRAANITKPINGRGACHYCGPCEHGCATHSYFNAAFTTVADALKSGNTTLITDAMVYRVLTDPATKKATGVMYIDRVTREVREVRARAVLLCAQALESARILFNSAEGGLANSSGVLGHYLMDHTWVAGGASGEFPDAPAPRPSLGVWGSRHGGPVR
jgi:choline dehydrogenase-like flavoprotein